MKASQALTRLALLLLSSHLGLRRLLRKCSLILSIRNCSDFLSPSRASRDHLKGQILAGALASSLSAWTKIQNRTVGADFPACAADACRQTMRNLGSMPKVPIRCPLNPDNSNPPFFAAKVHPCLCTSFRIKGTLNERTCLPRLAATRADGMRRFRVSNWLEIRQCHRTFRAGPTSAREGSRARSGITRQRNARDLGSQALATASADAPGADARAGVGIGTARTVRAGAVVRDAAQIAAAGGGACR
jgi:hypothetical protein